MAEQIKTVLESQFSIITEMGEFVVEHFEHESKHGIRIKLDDELIRQLYPCDRQFCAQSISVILVHLMVGTFGLYSQDVEEEADDQKEGQ